MNDAATDTAVISGYHAHVYYDATTKEAAGRLREAIDGRFRMTLGRRHDRPVGPHPRWSYQIAFASELFAEVVPWLALNRGDLVVFIHPITGDDLADHRDYALWLGAKLDLDLDVLAASDG
ncbi:MAG: DOPA 4,5-dioxygenase family protein [Rhodospirillales bacterium]|nr:DOPA 4,5-dioxygenase family protein [Rhodospirillales bacterium]MDP6773877.1 DOPA 4,5-dioxygenase family protein [Rhodospirillales bacterium]